MTKPTTIDGYNEQVTRDCERVSGISGYFGLRAPLSTRWRHCRRRTHALAAP